MVAHRTSADSAATAASQAAITAVRLGARHHRAQRAALGRGHRPVAGRHGSDPADRRRSNWLSPGDVSGALVGLFTRSFNVGRAGLEPATNGS
jgi:hypothetical protein